MDSLGIVKKNVQELENSKTDFFRPPVKGLPKEHIRTHMHIDIHMYPTPQQHKHHIEENLEQTQRIFIHTCMIVQMQRKKILSLTVFLYAYY